MAEFSTFQKSTLFNASCVAIVVASMRAGMLDVFGMNFNLRENK